MVNVCLFVADGNDEIEFSAPWGVFTRAQIPIDSVYVGENPEKLVTMSRGVQLYAKRSLKEFKSVEEFASHYDVVIVPGGVKGANTLSTDEFVKKVVSSYWKKAGKVIGMICAGTLTAKTTGLSATEITGHPSVRKDLEEAGFRYIPQPVVVENNLITSMGPGTALLWALKLLEQVTTKETYDTVYQALTMPEKQIVYAANRE
ncbi:ThiJ domain-containing protein [Schizosaccharomyces octosporus yFS286]|uniref:D-lactate dehydratase n=1 Tax=Schizosaccharomyces octosporus (strain yFS286) TaxID=483514 RepID=S9PZC8_SCHOY|nr:ThiJ domain-containing protein [Schizosaccharomyces octosporus yFS286]EPX72818.1 ThiJ domain-containing protein [Schizosaccharomyces octosporus yFS286]